MYMYIYIYIHLYKIVFIYYYFKINKYNNFKKQKTNIKLNKISKSKLIIHIYEVIHYIT